jgi:hypothetical protein
MIAYVRWSGAAHRAGDPAVDPAMPYLIDGHNLIAVVPGLSLADPDDEARLVLLLRTFCARRSTTATVYFDAGRAGRPSQATSASVRAHFVRRPSTADAAIQRHLSRLGKVAPNWTVVSSDREVIDAARRSRARTMSSRDFARLLLGPAAPGPDDDKPSVGDGRAEVSRWEAVFRSRRRKRA